MTKSRLQPEELEALMLARARAGLRPTAADRQATLARLGRNLTTPLATSSGAVNEPLTSVKAAGQFSLQALIAGVTAGVVLGFGGGYLSRAPTNPDEALDQRNNAVSVPSVAVSPSALTIDQKTVDNTRAIDAPSPVAPLAPRALEATADAGHALGPQVTPERKRESSAPPQGVSPYDELAYIRRAQLALKRGDNALALGLMRELDERQPSKTLAAERTVTRVLALCALGRSVEAQTLGAQLLRQDPTAAMYAPRLAASCAQTDSANQKNAGKVTPQGEGFAPGKHQRPSPAGGKFEGRK